MNTFNVEQTNLQPINPVRSLMMELNELEHLRVAAEERGDKIIVDYLESVISGMAVTANIFGFKVTMIDKDKSEWIL